MIYFGKFPWTFAIVLFSLVTAILRFALTRGLTDTGCGVSGRPKIPWRVLPSIFVWRVWQILAT